MSVLGLCGGVVKVIMAFWLGQSIGLAGVMLANVLTDVPGFVYLGSRVWHSLGLPVGQVWRHAIAPAMKASIPTLLVLIAVLVQPPAITWPWFFLRASVFALAWAVGTGGVGLLPSERNQVRLYIKRTLGVASMKTRSL